MGTGMVAQLKDTGRRISVFGILVGQLQKRWGQITHVLIVN